MSFVSQLLHWDVAVTTGAIDQYEGILEENQ